MRLLLSVGYNKLLFAPGANVSAIIASLDGAVAVNDEGYGAGRKLKLLADNNEIQVQLIPDADTVLPEVQDGGKDMLVRLTEEVAKLRTELYTKEQERKKAVEALGAAQKAVGVVA